MVFSEHQHPCPHGVDVLKVHQHRLNPAQQSNPASPPFRRG